MLCWIIISGRITDIWEIFYDNDTAVTVDEVLLLWTLLLRTCAELLTCSYI